MTNCPFQNVLLISLCLIHPTFATAVVWPDYGLGKQMCVPVCYGTETTMGTDHLLPLWHHFTSICWKQQDQWGPAWAIPLRGVKIIPGPWEESCLLIHFHARRFPSTLEGAYRLLFYVVCTLNGCPAPSPSRPLRQALSLLLSNMHTQNNTAVRQCLQCVGRRRLTPIQKDQDVSCKVQLLCFHPLPLCVSNTICKALQLLLADCGGWACLFLSAISWKLKSKKRHNCDRLLNQWVKKP